MTGENYTVSIERDDHTGIATHEVWLKGGEFHRIDGPACIHRDRVTGKVLSSRWYLEGKIVPYRERRKLRSLAKYACSPS